MDKKKILIVDDEAAFTEMVKLNLEATGMYEVHIELDSSKAIHTALLIQPDLMLLDVIMAKKEGPEVAMEMTKDDTLSKIPIVFLTATITKKEVDEEHGIVGGHPFVAKPSSLEVLLEAIEKNILVA